jgi:NAD(P)-dependent dehydrogenase (short-subunit alcohol dehydrogenase family)
VSAMFDPRECAIVTDELADRVIAVTGASDGIGRAVAIECARHGASVILVGRSERKLSGVLAEIEALPEDRRDSTIAVLDLEHALAQDYDRLSDAVLERFGRLDGLVHNAALLGTLSPIEHYDVPTWCRVLHVNLTAAFALTQVLLPLLRRSADASVVFTSSSVGRRGRAYWGAYAVSKFALEGLSQVLADELEGTSAIRVNTLNPGRARTAMRRQAYPAEDVATVPLPASLTGPYLALLGPASRGLTGGAFDAQPSASAPASAGAAPDRSSRSSPDSSSRA